MADASFVSFTNMVETIKQNSDMAQTYVYNFMAGAKPKAALSASKKSILLFLNSSQGTFSIITVTLRTLFLKMHSPAWD